MINNINEILDDCVEDKNIDFIFCHELSRQYLSKYTLIIASRLSQKDLDKIKEYKIYLFTSMSPISIISNINLPLEANEKSIFIIFDQTTAEHLKLMTDEGAGMIMHEIGHILNPCPKDKEREDIIFKEFYADDYARSKKFKIGLKSSLSKYSNSNLPWIMNKKDQLEKRIKRLNDDNVKLYL